MKPMWTVDCSFFSCHERPLFLIETRGTVRLGEQWYTCETHITKLLLWLVNRDKAWDLPTDKVTIIEVDHSQARA